MSKRMVMTEEEATWLARFIPRGWIHGTREDAMEASAVKKGLRMGFLRKELSEVHFTPEGRIALS